MAIITPTYLKTLHQVTATWANISTGDTVAPHAAVVTPNMPSVQFEGTFGGANAYITGSLSNITYSNAVNMAQTELDVTSNSIHNVLNTFSYWKPAVVNGTGDSITVTLTYWNI